MSLLRVNRGRFIDGRGRDVSLKGVNLGTWLLLEGYMLGGPNEPEHRIRRSFADVRGAPAAKSFFQKFQDVYIQEDDLRRIKRWGFNVVRIPFNYRLLVDGPHGDLVARNGWKKLDWVVRTCETLGLYCILDMHAAPGAQNHDWHSDSDGKARLWTSPKERALMADLWGRIAHRYRHAASVAGYDILNEPITDEHTTLNRLYADCRAAVRDQKDDHVVFLEGPTYATDLTPLDNPDDPQVAWSVHFYEPHNFTFNWAMDLTYPGVIDGKKWDRRALDEILSRHAVHARRTQRPVLVGEFGINSRCPCCHAEHRWLGDVLSLFKRHGFHWTYWSYKVVAGHMHPGGLLRYTPNPAWVNRHGVKIAWETYGEVSKNAAKQILESFQSRHWVEDAGILSALKSFT
jgi:aryl-phospho-beta-D-glucosidase BglC (GH1 family)